MVLGQLHVHVGKMNFDPYLTSCTISTPGELLILVFLIIYSFLAALGLCCCSRAFSSSGEWGLLFVVVRGLLIAVPSLCCGAQALGAWAY